MPVKLFDTALTPLKHCDSLWPDVSMPALIKVEDILSKRCELEYDSQRDLNFLNCEFVLYLYYGSRN